MIRLITVDAGHTLGTFGRYGTDDLVELSPLSKARVKEAARQFLHCTPEPTPEVLADFCEAICIEPAQLPRDWTSTFTAYAYAREAVAHLVEITAAPAVVLSNIPCTTGPSRMAALARQIPVIETIYTSYEMGRRKPDRRLWQRIAADHDVLPSDIVHIGDHWVNDVWGAARAGCRAIFLDGTRENNAAPPREEWPETPPGHLAVARDLPGAVPIVAELHAT